MRALESGLPRDCDERRAIELRIGHAGEQVRRAGSERRETDARIRGETPVHIGHERRALLMTREHEARLLAAVERLVERKRLFTGDAEHVAHAFVLEAANEKLGGVHRGNMFIVTQYARARKTFSFTAGGR